MNDMKKYRYFTCDVFTDTRFGGNQLAVLPDAMGLTTAQMQNITREFNYSETVFVLPGNDRFTRKLRIFTPTKEIPFAGHPNIGTAFTLATEGAFGEIAEPIDVLFDEGAGPVAIRVEPREDARYWCELRAPAQLEISAELPVAQIARVLSLDDSAILTNIHAPRVASVGLPFVCAQVRDREALAAARIDLPALEQLAAEGITPDIHFYYRSNDEFDLRARMLAPLDGVPEDPATGSANCALAGLLSSCEAAADGTFRYRIAQGVEMGRPSLLEARTEKRGGEITGVWIGGDSVLVSEGWLTL